MLKLLIFHDIVLLNIFFEYFYMMIHENKLR